MINRQRSQGKVFEGWFVDIATGYRRSTSKLANMMFTRAMASLTKYNAIVVTEESENDVNPYPAVPILRSMLQQAFGQ